MVIARSRYTSTDARVKITEHSGLAFPARIADGAAIRYGMVWTMILSTYVTVEINRDGRAENRPRPLRQTDYRLHTIS
jgi:hypothetical protein